MSFPKNEQEWYDYILKNEDEIAKKLDEMDRQLSKAFDSDVDSATFMIAAHIFSCYYAVYINSMVKDLFPKGVIEYNEGAGAALAAVQSASAEAEAEEIINNLMGDIGRKEQKTLPPAIDESADPEERVTMKGGDA